MCTGDCDREFLGSPNNLRRRLSRNPVVTLVVLPNTERDLTYWRLSVGPRTEVPVVRIGRSVLQ